GDGGMGGSKQEMGEAWVEGGVSVRTEDPVREVSVSSGRAVGVVTESGEEHHASCVVSGINPRLLFGRLVKPSELPPDFRQAISNYRCASGTFRMNVALSELARF